MKFEKVTLWTCTETYGNNPSLSALDYIGEALENLEFECKLLDSEAEEYKLVPDTGGKEV